MSRVRAIAASLVFVGLSAGLPAAAAAQGQCSVPSNLAGWWPLDGTTTDIAGGHNGTLVGGATSGQATPGRP